MGKKLAPGNEPHVDNSDPIPDPSLFGGLSGIEEPQGGAEVVVG